jgi:hypothetical protein
VTVLITEIVDLDRYPLDRDQSLAGLAGDCAEAFAADGVVALPGFVRPEGVARMAEECDAAAPDGHHSEVTNTVYLGLPHDGVDPEDPRARTVRSSLRAVAADCIPQTHALRQLYEWAPLREFLRHVLGVTELHPYADPLGALNIADMTVEDELGWHFDQTDFVTSLSIRTAGVGGHFEVAAGLRTATDENLTAVRSVLDGATDGVVQLRFDPGTLLIFAGRWSMHRVTPIEAGPSRLVGLLAFDTKPGTDSSELLKLVRYGRTAARDVPWVAATGGE